MKYFIILISLVLSACVSNPPKGELLSRDDIIKINNSLLVPCKELIPLNRELKDDEMLLRFIVDNSVIYSECANKQQGAAEILRKALNYYEKLN